MNHLDQLIDESLDRLHPARVEQADWEDILTRLRNESSRRRPRYRWPMAAAAAIVFAAVALAVTTPWRNGPSVIAKASAAISAESTQDVLHEQATLTLQVLHCAGGARHGRCPAIVPKISVQLWVEGGTGFRSFREITRIPSPHPTNMRIEVPAAPFGNALASSNAQTQVVEVGGTLGPSHVGDALVYQRYSNTLIRYTQAPTSIASTAFDPVALVRAALTAGHAHNAGTAVIAGRRVRAIRVELDSVDRGAGTATYYVDRSTYAPVEILYPRANFLQFPYTTTPVFGDSEPFGVVVRFSTFETLPATQTTRALTDIRSQYPTAKIVCGVEFGLPDC
jgi:hypothetical protein